MDPLGGLVLPENMDISQLALGGPMMKQAQEKRLENQIQNSSNKIEKLINKLNDPNNLDTQTKNTIHHDWSARYDFWSEWEDIEELGDTLDNEKTKLQSLKEGQASFMGHHHDHSEEKKIFELPEKEKIIYCERYRQLGNYLALQGFYSKALEHFQIALSYYEYCFPEDKEAELHLASIRHACLNNAALCSCNLSMFREALQYATQVIRESKGTNAKAYYRRAQAFRGMDEYQNAMIEFENAALLCPNDAIIAHEINLLKKQQQISLQRERVMAKNMLNIPSKLDTDVEADATTAVTALNMNAGSGSGSGSGSGLTNVVTVDELPKLLNIFLPLEAVPLTSGM